MEPIRTPLDQVNAIFAARREAIIAAELQMMVIEGKTPERGWRLAVYSLPRRLDADGHTIHDDFTTARIPPGKDPFPHLMGGVLAEVYGQ